MPNTIIREKIYIADLKVGMYVCELDRPWLETPYPLQGFFLKTDSDIQGLIVFCQYVYIDIRRSLEDELNELHSQPISFQNKTKSIYLKSNIKMKAH